MLIAAFDPGKTNFAYAIIDTESNELLKTGMINNTIKSVTTDVKLRNSINEFKREVRRILYGLKLTPTDAVILERMQYRPGRGHAPAELVNLMIGVLLHDAANRTQVHLVMPATWKTHYKRVFSYCIGNCKYCANKKCLVVKKNKRYCSMWKNDSLFKTLLQRMCGIEVSTDHEADATCIACYLAGKEEGNDRYIKLLRKA